MNQIQEKKCVDCRTFQDCIWYAHINGKDIHGFICENCFYENAGIPDGGEQ
jgi:hypothetical protein